jgi:hypothetical protein
MAAREASWKHRKATDMAATVTQNATVERSESQLWV